MTEIDEENDENGADGKPNGTRLCRLPPRHEIANAYLADEHTVIHGLIDQARDRRQAAHTNLPRFGVGQVRTTDLTALGGNAAPLSLGRAVRKRQTPVMRCQRVA